MEITKLFMDTEFTGLHQQTSLISVALIDETGQRFYAELNDYKKCQCDDWIIKNVIGNLKHKHIMSMPELRKNLLNWLSSYVRVEIWGDCISYDWVLFNEIFGGAFNLPRNIYYIPFDLCTLFKFRGINPDIDREEFLGINKSVSKHNALWDTHIIKKCYEKLMRVNFDGTLL